MNKVIFYSERWLNGGIEELINNIILNSNHSKFEFNILVGQKETNSYDNSLNNYNIKIQEIHKKHKKNPIFRTILSFIKFKKHIKKLDKENKAIIHINIYNSIGLIFGLFFSKKERIVFHAHNNGIDSSNDKLYIKRFSNFLFKHIFTYKNCNYIACSNLAADFCFNTKKINDYYVMKNGIDSKKFIFNEKYRKDKRKELNIKNDTLLIGHVGRFVEQKNHKFLIELFYEYLKLNNNSKLLLIGSGPLEEKMKDKVKKLNIENAVIFLGNTKEVNKYMSAMDLFLFPSLYEGLGIVLIEAQCEDLKCITSYKTPRLVKIDDKLCFEKLDKAKWISLIKNFKVKSRNNNLKKIKDSGYDIKDSVASLNKKYEVIINEE